MKRPASIVILAVAAVVVLAVIRVMAPAPGDAGGGAATVPHFQLADVRVRITEDPVVSRGQDPVLVQLESGTIPEGVTAINVLTDENCQPDADGVSHCLNRVQFMTADGKGEAILRHHHKMAEEPCLTPGQNVELVR